MKTRNSDAFGYTVQKGRQAENFEIQPGTFEKTAQIRDREISWFLAICGVITAILVVENSVFKNLKLF